MPKCSYRRLLEDRGQTSFRLPTTDTPHFLFNSLFSVRVQTKYIPLYAVYYI